MQAAQVIAPGSVGVLVTVPPLCVPYYAGALLLL